MFNEDILEEVANLFGEKGGVEVLSGEMVWFILVLIF